ncbi:MAG: hypothetical protein RR743_05620, partial [Oscillospiraceae bacterium]
VVGRVLKMSRHENSDHMFICSIDVGGAEPLTIVTGAQNVSEGDLVPVAQDGSTLPGGVTIRTGELRGVVSAGMLCSLKELGLTLHDYPYAFEDGILVLQSLARWATTSKKSSALATALWSLKSQTTVPTAFLSSVLPVRAPQPSIRS